MHPCAGMSPAAHVAFERVAINQPPLCAQPIVEALIRKGLVVRSEPKQMRDALGAYEIPQYAVPIPIHYQWCCWCSEQPGMDDADLG